MSAPKTCPCESEPIEFDITNVAGRSAIDYRVGDFLSFRRVLLLGLPAETQLRNWRPGPKTDLALQMVEWWAYLADILTFYNERIANQSYLRTADLPESVNRLIRILGYRPRPGIAATGHVAALVSGNSPVLLKAGFAIDSKPGPGQDPQTFELDRDTIAVPSGRVPAHPPEFLFAPATSHFLIQGASTQVAAGTHLLLTSRDLVSTPVTPILLQAASVTVETTPAKAKQTRVVFTALGAMPAAALAAKLRLQKASQTSPIFTLLSEGISSNVVHLAGLQRGIRAGDFVILTAPNVTPLLAKVDAAQELIWWPDPKIPVLHTQLTLSVTPSASFANAPAAVTVFFAFQDITPLIDQPSSSFNGTPGTLNAIQPALFRTGTGLSILLEDANGAGMKGVGAVSDNQTTLIVSGLPTPAVTLTPPVNILYNLLSVSRGKTVASEVLGSGDATIAGQEFVLKKSPVTYLAKGASLVCTIQLRVAGQLWQQVPSFFEQPLDARVFVTVEDESQKTHVKFGDGINGALLPTGVNNVVATYRYGSGATAPAAGQLTVIAKPLPNLIGIRNPLAVGGGADPDPPDQIRRYAPRSVLAFNRAVSADDYEVIAAQAPGVTRARSYWAWSTVQQRGLVTVYVGDTPVARDSAQAALASTSDPNRPVQVLAATPVLTWLLMLVLVDPDFVSVDVANAVRTEFVDPDRGVFCVNRLRIGEAVFDSQIAEAALRVPGAISVRASLFITFFWNVDRFEFKLDAGPRHVPGDGAFFSTQASLIWVFTEVASNGG